MDHLPSRPYSHRLRARYAGSTAADHCLEHGIGWRCVCRAIGRQRTCAGGYRRRTPCTRWMLGTGQIEWQTNVGEPAPRSALPCGNIDPLGITGTPVYDPATGLVFAVAEVRGPAHILVGIDARTGEVRVHRSADPEGMEPLAHQQRAALTLSNGLVYIAYGGLFGDCGNYHGWVVGSRTDGSGPLLAYQVPTEREGGIWARAGPSVDAGAGRLYVSTGNGSETSDGWDHSDSILRLSPTLKLSTKNTKEHQAFFLFFVCFRALRGGKGNSYWLKLEDGFAPDQWRAG